MAQVMLTWNFLSSLCECESKMCLEQAGAEALEGGALEGEAA
jgi:hypothetical protein